MLLLLGIVKIITLELLTGSKIGCYSMFEIMNMAKPQMNHCRNFRRESPMHIRAISALRLSWADRGG